MPNAISIVRAKWGLLLPREPQPALRSASVHTDHKYTQDRTELRQNRKVVSMNRREFTGFELCCIDWKVQGFTSWQLITITYMLNSTILKSLLGVYEAASTYMSLVHQLWHADRVGYLCICTWPSAIGAHRDSWTVIGGNNSHDRQVKECRKCRLLMYFGWNEAKNARISS